MRVTSTEAARIASDPAWLAHRYDPTGDDVHFVEAPRATHRSATFLTDEYLPGTDRPTVIRRGEALAALRAAAPIHFIFHSAYCCSTLLARAFDIERVAMGLKEPLILNDLSGWRQRGAEAAQLAAVLESVLTLLARPFAPGEAVIVKPSNLINPFAATMLAMRPQAHAVLLHAPLALYLASIARKGMWGRLWVRELYWKLSRYGILDYGFTPEEILRQTDLQIAAIGWLGQHRLFADLVRRYPERVRTLDSETLVGRPAEVIARLSEFYGLDLGAEAVEAVAAGDAFTSHSKGGGAFGARERQAEQRDGAAVHAEEVEKVTVWAEAVASSAGQPLVLPAPLIA